MGAIASYGVALSYVAASMSALLMPPELQGRPEISPHEFWTVLSRNPTAHLVYHWASAASGFFGIAAVPAISLLVWGVHRGAVLWSGLAAFLGFAIGARSHLMEVAWDRKIIAVYESADPAFQQAVHVVAGLALDIPDGVFTYGAPGVWVGITSLLLLRAEDIPRLFSYLGLATAVALIVGVVGFAFLVRSLVVVSVGLGGFVLVPAWFILAGLLLRRSAIAAATAAGLGTR